MPDFRCFCESAASSNGTVELSPEESNHLVAANRARDGDPVRVFNGKGSEWDATVLRASKRQAVLELGQAIQIPPPPYRIALAQALPKGKLIESIIRKATEIGIQQVFPLLTSRVESKIDPKRESAKNAKWRAATLEGAKQSGNPHLLSIEPLSQLDPFLAAATDFDLKLIASLTSDATSIKQHLARYQASHNGQRPQSVIWLVGPEGDFTPEETDAALRAGFLPASLGPHVMRCETAAVAALAIIRHEIACGFGSE